MNKHTPGPWTLDGSRILTGDGFKSCIASTNVFGVPESKVTAEDKANARLMAAAPDMLEALKAVVVDLPPLDGLEGGTTELAQLVTNAIAKAEGN